MSRALKGQDFLTLMDFSLDDLLFFLDYSRELKEQLASGQEHDHLKGKTIAMFFEKPSTRTRISFHTAVGQLGAQSFHLTPAELQMSRGELIRDTARVIDRYCDALVMRTFGQSRLEEFARFMEKPVINALSNESHPCQCLADLLTIREKKGQLKGLKLMYTGDVSNVVNSLMVGGSMIGMDVTIAGPIEFKPESKYWHFAQENARSTGSLISYTPNFEEGLEGADIVYTNTWTPMHLDEAAKLQREKMFRNYQVNSEAMKKAKEDAIFMHCLPGFRDREMTNEVIEGAQSVVWDQAENRLHTAKAILDLLIG